MSNEEFTREQEAMEMVEILESQSYVVAELTDRIAELEADRATLPRPAIMAFARLMEAKLKTKDALEYSSWQPYKNADGWHNLTKDHWGHFQTEVAELQRELFGRPNGSHVDVINEAADVANMAMILIDAIEPLCEHDGRGRAKVTGDGA